MSHVRAPSYRRIAIWVCAGFFFDPALAFCAKPYVLDTACQQDMAAEVLALLAACRSTTPEQCCHMQVQLFVHLAGDRTFSAL
jgi:hypothetical protein